jgi:hypothetical protein
VKEDTTDLLRRIADIEDGIDPEKFQGKSRLEKQGRASAGGDSEQALPGRLPR